VSYDDHTVAEQQSKDTSFKLVGLRLAHDAGTDTDWNRQYRDGEHEAKTERGYERDDSYTFHSDDKSTVVLDPKGAEGVAMVLGAKQRVSQDQRDVLAQRGPEAFDMPKETIEAWRKGDLHEDEMTDIAVTLNEAQLGQVRDRIAVPEQGRTGMMAH